MKNSSFVEIYYLDNVKLEITLENNTKCCLFERSEKSLDSKNQQINYYQ